MGAKVRFAIPADKLKALTTGRGSCYATDRITRGGERVGYMYREQPDNAHDSGWRFFAGDESQEYVNDPAHLAFYDVNTIANYDPEIIPLLDAAPGSAFDRDASGMFVPVEFEPDS